MTASGTTGLRSTSLGTCLCSYLQSRYACHALSPKSVHDVYTANANSSGSHLVRIPQSDRICSVWALRDERRLGRLLATRQQALPFHIPQPTVHIQTTPSTLVNAHSRPIFSTDSSHPQVARVSVQCQKCPVLCLFWQGPKSGSAEEGVCINKSAVPVSSDRTEHLMSITKWRPRTGRSLQQQSVQDSIRDRRPIPSLPTASLHLCVSRRLEHCSHDPQQRVRCLSSFRAARGCWPLDYWIKNQRAAHQKHSYGGTN